MINTQLTHLSDKCMEKETDWYKHQVSSSCNFGIKRNTFMNKMHSMVVTFFSGGLNYQIEHHLFPGVNQWHLPAISQLVQLVCQKHNVPYKSFEGYADAFIHHLRYILKLSRRIQN